MNQATVKTFLGVAVTLGTVAHLLLVHAGGFTKEDAIVYGVLLLFAGILIDPAEFKSLLALVPWKKP